MASYNHVTLVGNLVHDAELKYLPSGTAVLNFTVAINEKWRDKQSGEMKEDVSYVDCSQFGQGAEKVCEYMKKGRPILVDGRLKQDRWETQGGDKRSKIKVNVNRVTLLGSRKAEGGEAAPSNEDIEV